MAGQQGWAAGTWTDGETGRLGVRAGALCAMLICGCLTLPAQGAAGLHAVARVTSDYLSGSYSKSDGHPTIQGNVDYLGGAGIYAGTWVSAIDFGGASAEAITYAGAHRKFSEDFSGDLSLAGYWYDRQVFDRTAHYGEVYSSLHFRDLATLGLSMAPDVYGRGHSATNLNLKLRLPITDVLQFNVGIGHEWASKAYDYDSLLWSLGTSWYLGRHLTIDLAWRGARQINEQPHEEPVGKDLADLVFDDRLVLSVSYGL